MTAALLLKLFDVAALVPEAYATLRSWFVRNPDATPEQIAEQIGRYEDLAAARRRSVAEFNADL